MYHNKKVAQDAETHFDLIHKQREIPTDIPEYIINTPLRLIDLMVETKLVNGKGEARRLIRQGGVKLDNETIKDELLEITTGSEKILKVGKRKFLKIVS